jgi:RNA polymerase sigma-70 factor (ECF subfamily)
LHRRGNVAAVPHSLESWFQREILAHEAALVRFLSRKLRNAADVQDVRHDIYVRILEAAERELPANPKAFLFSVARHLLIDRARRERIVAIDLLEDLDSLNVLIEEKTPERREAGRQQLQKLSLLIQRLPVRCREVVWMRRVEDVPQKVIAQRLGITEGTVEKHLVRGIRMMRSGHASMGILIRRSWSCCSPRRTIRSTSLRWLRNIPRCSTCSGSATLWPGATKRCGVRIAPRLSLPPFASRRRDSLRSNRKER